MKLAHNAVIDHNNTSTYVIMSPVIRQSGQLSYEIQIIVGVTLASSAALTISHKTITEGYIDIHIQVRLTE